jgi:hypothetical protein
MTEKNKKTMVKAVVVITIAVVIIGMLAPFMASAVN